MSKQYRGFAAMDPKMQREIASMGGKTAAQKGTKYKFDKETASRAGKLGAQKRQENKEKRLAENVERAIFDPEGEWKGVK